MKTIRMIILIVCAIFVYSSAMAGNTPEFDAVGNDSLNYFNDFVNGMVIDNNVNTQGEKINLLSNFRNEYFSTTAGQPAVDPCFPGYFSCLTPVYTSATYEWQIVLQMQPESDIDLNIVDCVLKHNEFNPFGGAEQTGRYRMPWGQLVFNPMANPRVTVEAIPGPYATPGFVAPFYLDARTIPGLDIVAMVNVPYTSKALWDESIVLVMPESGLVNTAGQATYFLRQGDSLNVKVEIPGINTADVRYGRDNVILKYIGVVYTEYVGSE